MLCIVELNPIHVGRGFSVLHLLAIKRQVHFDQVYSYIILQLIRNLLSYYFHVFNPYL